MAEARVTSVVVEAITSPGDPDARTTSLVVEAMTPAGDADARVTSLIVEAMYLDPAFQPLETAGAGYGIPAGIT
jgi:hypothetical protein